MFTLPPLGRPVVEQDDPVAPLDYFLTSLFLPDPECFLFKAIWKTSKK